MTVYYVDASRGSDSNNGTSPDSAWSSVAKVNAIRFQPGDQILFKAGDVYHEALVPRSSGTADHPITFGSFGDGPAPTFEGSVDLSGAKWTETCPGSNVWTTSFRANDGGGPDAIYINDTPLGNKVADGSVCDKGQWSWSGGKLTVYSNGTPADDSVEAQTESRSLKIMGVNNITVENLHFTQANEGIAIYNSYGTKLVNLEVDGNYTNGLEVSKSHDIAIEGGSYHDNGRITQWYNAGHGIVFNKGAYDNVVDGVAAYGNAEDGVQFYNDSGSGNVIRNSQLYDNNEDGVDIKLGSQTIEDSTLWGNKQEGINVHDNAGVTYIYDNIVSGLRHGLDVSEWASVISSGNVYEGIAKNAVRMWNIYGKTSSFTDDIFTIGPNGSGPAYSNESPLAHFLDDIFQTAGYDWRAALARTVEGTQGADEVTLGGGVEVLALGDGNDCATVTADGLATLTSVDGGLGSDELCLAGGGTFDLAAPESFTGIEGVNLLAGGLLLLRNGVNLDVAGSDAVDTVVLGTGSENVDLGGGDDEIRATTATLNAGDSLHGGAGTDTLVLSGGGAFDLRLLAQLDGFERVSLTGGGVLILRDGLSLAVTGSAGQDVVVLGTGSHVVDLAGGDDALHVTSAALSTGDNLAGGDGFDTLFLDGGGSFNLAVLGGLAGFERIVVSDLSSTVILPADTTIEVIGGAGHDSLYGSALADKLSGGGGDDLLHGGAGGDTLDGGDGFDVASYAASDAGVQVNLAAEVAVRGHASGDVLLNMEGLIGSDYGDQLVGDGGANILAGGGGNDFINGRAGDDTVFGGDGNDALTGLTGSDRMYGGTGDDVLNGGAGRDLLWGEEGADRFVFAAKDSGTTATGRDVIGDFSQAEHDLIDLTGMGSLHFVGSGAFSRTAGELHYAAANGVTVIEGDVDGDGRADFQIEVTGTVHFTADDFVL